MKNERIYLIHMRDTCRRILEKVGSKTRDQFLADDTLVLAVTHLLQTIGEAARLVPEQLRSSYPNIPWTLITGMRHRIVHDYLNVDVEVVWKAASEHVGQLLSELETMPHLLAA